MLDLLKAVPGEIESDQMLDDRIIVQLQKVCKLPNYENTFFIRSITWRHNDFYTELYKVDAFIHLEQVEDAEKLAHSTMQQVGII